MCLCLCFLAGSVQFVLPWSAFQSGRLCATAQSLLSSYFVEPLGYSLLAFLSVSGYAFTSLHPVPATAVLFLLRRPRRLTLCELPGVLSPPVYLGNKVHVQDIKSSKSGITGSSC